MPDDIESPAVIELRARLVDVARLRVLRACSSLLLLTMGDSNQSPSVRESANEVFTALNELISDLEDNFAERHAEAAHHA